MKCLALLLCATLVCGQNRTRSRRICPGESHYVIGGPNAQQNEFPWQAALQVAERKGILSKPTWHHHCGASIIKNKWLVTAAHCLHNNIKLADFRVVAGSLQPLNPKSISIQTRKVSQLILHPNWHLPTVMNDIALIKLEKALEMGPAVSPIALPKNESENAFDGRHCVATGWGQTSLGGSESDVLLKVALPVVPNTLCAERYKTKKVSITPTRICAGRLDVPNIGPCAGDSGGPLACPVGHSYVLAGLTSFTAECGSKVYPSVFTRLSSYASWIEKHVS